MHPPHAFLASHTFPTQQPTGHDVALQTHVPAAPHSSPVPHAAHAAPGVPQVALLSAWHIPVVSQQPVGHDVALQTHLPVASQLWPCAQATHAAPPAPHWPIPSLARATHVPVASQQPPGHDAASHAHLPAVHTCVAAHAAQATPPVPHVALPEVWHFPVASQQPFGHDLASQTHLPWVLHSWFVPHAAHTPPFAPHSRLVTGVTQVPSAQHPAQLTPPHEHSPPLHVCPPAHAPQALPPDPQPAVDCASTSTQPPSPAQQPPAHDVAVQAH